MTLRVEKQRELGGSENRIKEEIFQPPTNCTRGNLLTLTITRGNFVTLYKSSQQRTDIVDLITPYGHETKYSFYFRTFCRQPVKRRGKLSCYIWKQSMPGRTETLFISMLSMLCQSSSTMLYLRIKPQLKALQHHKRCGTG